VDIFWGAFPKLRKANVIFVMSVRPHGTTRFPLDGFCMKFDIWAFLQKSAKKLPVSLKSQKSKA